MYYMYSHDMSCAEVISHYRTEYGRVTPFENVIRTNNDNVINSSFVLYRHL